MLPPDPKAVSADSTWTNPLSRRWLQGRDPGKHKTERKTTGLLRAAIVRRRFR